MKPPEKNSLPRDRFGADLDATLPQFLQAEKRKWQRPAARQIGMIFGVVVVLAGLGLVAFRRTKPRLADSTPAVATTAGKTISGKPAAPLDPAAVSVAKIRTRRFNAVQKTEPVLPAPKPKFAIHASSPPPKTPLAGVPVQVVSSEPFLAVVETSPMTPPLSGPSDAEKIGFVEAVGTELGATIAVETQTNGYDVIGDQTLLSSLGRYDPVLVADPVGQVQLVFADPEGYRVLFRQDRPF